MGAVGLGLAVNQALHQHWRARPGASPQSELCHPGQNLCWAGIGLLPETRNFSGNFSFPLHCLGSSAKAVQAWAARGCRAQQMAGRCLQQELVVTALGRSLGTATAHRQVTSVWVPPWHSPLVPWWLRRGWKLILTIFIGLLVATQHILPLERGTLQFLSSPSRDISNRWRFKSHKWKLQT